MIYHLNFLQEQWKILPHRIRKRLYKLAKSPHWDEDIEKVVDEVLLELSNDTSPNWNVLLDQDSDIKIQKVGNGYELRLSDPNHHNKYESRVAELFHVKRWIDSWTISVPMNGSMTPWTFFVPVKLISEMFSLSSVLQPGYTWSLIEETGKVCVTISLHLPGINTYNDYDDDYHSRDDEALWWPLPEWRDRSPEIRIHIRKKDWFDRHDPVVREEIEWFLAKYKKMIEDQKGNS